ncbi:MAG: hypothetical protein LAO09_23330 [Acidobacteriia bacterium]|nr:hypothetical protein [Terriglobia bacterium]
MDKPCHLAAYCAIRRLTGSDGLALYPKRRGELAELIFVLKAATMGLAVSKPFGDSFPYDVVIESNHRMLRVQVKSSFSSHRAGYCINLGARGEAGGHRLYTPEEIDFVAAYVVCHDAWYIIPATALGTAKSVRLYPAGSRKKGTGHFEGYREAWDLITGIGRPPPRLPSPQLLASSY